MTTATTALKLSTLNSDWVRNFSNQRSEPPWLVDLRLRAFDQYTRLPWPSSRDERWKRSGLDSSKFDQLKFQLTPTPPLHMTEPTPSGVTKSSVDDVLRTNPDLVQGIWELAVSRAQANKFLSLTLALGNGGSLFFVPKNQLIDTPIRHKTVPPDSGEASFSLHFLIVEEGSHIQFWDEMAAHHKTASQSDDLGFLSSFTAISLGPTSQTALYSLQNWDESIQHLHFQDITQQKDSRMNSVIVELGSRKFRSESVIRLDGVGAENKVLGVLFGHQNQAFENWITQNHTAPKTTSDIQFRGALKGQSQSFFSGLISITKVAQQSDAYQSCKSLLLSKEARAEAIPNLEILADDVKCSHGAAMGPVDLDQKFYLQTRGVSPTEAEKIIVQGFFESVIADVPSESTQESLRQSVEEKLATQ